MPRSFTVGRPHPESPGEIALAAHLPQFRCNIYCLVRHVDFIHDAAKVVVEVDGRTYHDTADAYEKDRHQDATLMEAGYVVVRFASRTVMDSPYHVAARVMRIVEERTKGREDLVRRWEAEMRASDAERRLAAEQASETRTYRLTRSIGNYYKDAVGAEFAGTVVKGLNVKMKQQFGSASTRTDEDWKRARDWLDDTWTQIRVKADIKAAKIPAWDATPCATCGRFVCDGWHCLQCGVALAYADESISLCRACDLTSEGSCMVCLNPCDTAGLDRSGACPWCSAVAA